MLYNIEKGCILQQKVAHKSCNTGCNAKRNVACYRNTIFTKNQSEKVELWLSYRGLGGCLKTRYKLAPNQDREVSTIRQNEKSMRKECNLLRGSKPFQREYKEYTKRNQHIKTIKKVSNKYQG